MYERASASQIRSVMKKAIPIDRPIRICIRTILNTSVIIICFLYKNSSALEPCTCGITSHETKEANEVV